MCLCIKGSYNSKCDPNKFKKIAKKDIVCYKVCKLIFKNKKSIYQSICQQFNYELGYHYYQTDKKFRYGYGYGGGYIAVFVGLHSYTQLNKAKSNSLKKIHKIIECVIPKDSEYFVGVDNDYVSDNLIFIKEVKY